jgi:transcriptional antiterminator RfaH
MRKLIPGWYVGYTRPNHERKVLVGLTENEIVTFLPTIRKIRNSRDQMKCIEEPLFRSYIFVYLKDGRDHSVAMHTEGLLYFVNSGHEIARINEKTINDLRLVVSKGLEVEVVDTSFSPGQQLTITRGPLLGLQCEMVDWGAGRRLLVRVNLLRRSILVRLQPECVTPSARIAI